MAQVADVVDDGQIPDFDVDLGEHGFVGGVVAAGNREGDGVELRKDEGGFKADPHGDGGQCFLEMVVADLDGLQVGNAHLSNLGAVDGELAFALEVAQELGELGLDVLDRVLLLDPLRQFTLHLLSVQVASLVDLLVLLLEVEGLAPVSLPQLF